MENVFRGHAKIRELKNSLLNEIKGQEELVDAIIIALLTNSHILIEGLPGVAKTTAVMTMGEMLYGSERRGKAINAAIRGDFLSGKPLQRAQFIPDMQPSDLIGGFRPRQEGEEQVRLDKVFGKIFTHLFIADEINRAPSKVQAALLQVMQEREADIIDFNETYAVNKYNLFSVFATQNPIEEEGTYPLAQAFLDRFLFKITVNLPESSVLGQLGRRADKSYQSSGEWFASPQDGPLFGDFSEVKDIIDQVNNTESMLVPCYVHKYAANIIEATYRRPEKENGFGRLASSGIYDYLVCGVSPRALESLIIAGKGYAFMNDRNYVTPSDIQQVAFAVLNHRLRLTFEAMSLKGGDNSLERHIVDEIIDNVGFSEELA